NPSDSSCLQPLVERMEKDVGQQRRDDSTLRCSRRCISDVHLFHHPRFQKGSYQLQHLSVRDSAIDLLEQLFVVDVVEETGDISVHYPTLPGSQGRLQPLTRRVGRASGPKAVAPDLKLALEDRLYQRSQRLLHHLVTHAWKSERALPGGSRFVDP